MYTQDSNTCYNTGAKTHTLMYMCTDTTIGQYGHMHPYSPTSVHVYACTYELRSSDNDITYYDEAYVLSFVCTSAHIYMCANESMPMDMYFFAFAYTSAK